MSRIIGSDLYFPILDRQNLRGGVTIRAAFAMTAMQGMLSSGPSINLNAPETVANQAVKHADALIEELNKGTE